MSGTVDQPMGVPHFLMAHGLKFLELRVFPSFFLRLLSLDILGSNDAVNTFSI